MIKVDALGKGMYFNYVVDAISKRKELDTNPNTTAHTGGASYVLARAAEDLGNILADNYHAVLESPSHMETIEIVKRMGYVPSGSLEEQKAAARKVLGGLIKAVADLEKARKSPSKFYEDEEARERLLETCTLIRELYDEKSGIANVHVFG